MLRARSVGTLGVRGQPVRSPFFSVILSAVGDSVASHSRYSLAAVSVFTRTTASEDAVQTVEIQQPLDDMSLGVQKLLRKSSYSVMRRIEMFALSKSLPPHLVDFLDLKWMQSTQYLGKIVRNSVKFGDFDLVQNMG